MDISRAMELIRNVTYKPEWHWTVQPHTNRFKDTVLVTMYYNVRDTAYGYAPDYAQFIEVFSSWPIMVGELNEEQLYAELFRIIMKIELHESREFFSVRTSDGNYSRKPYHPHREDGMHGYAVASNQDAISVIESDLGFGVAFARESAPVKPVESVSNAINGVR